MIKLAIEEMINEKIQGVKYKYISKWDLEIEKVWFLKQNDDHSLKDERRKRKDVVWQGPPPGWLKLNFDGASKGNPGRGGLGAIVRDEFGNILKAFSGSGGFVTNNVAEISALEVGLKWCATKSMDKLVIEGDSQIILNGISLSKFQNWRLNNWLSRIKMLLDSLGDYHIQHMFREGNKATDALANLGIEEPESTLENLTVLMVSP
ncbi:uncharacterized protein LOC131858830 [Cryptomeria japonica]|uniref:uncharacterized protein LOC131858830 n=1 Tax=Cryptomeria japonica TaxID=3369 RepID=UPI0027D9F089|nr:uncharacterized protein LOC131858830 [Cryptomeria japonica]